LSESGCLFLRHSYFAIFFAAATDSTITISPITLPFTVALSPAGKVAGYVAGQGEAGQMTGNGSFASIPISSW
jgi:hypothetical protein